MTHNYLSFKYLVIMLIKDYKFHVAFFLSRSHVFFAAGNYV